ncbi:unnamed protein product, partial [Urochloa humidicola]
APATSAAIPSTIQTAPATSAVLPSYRSTPFEERRLKEAQDSIDNSIFDFAIGKLVDEEEIQSVNKEA